MSELSASSFDTGIPSCIWIYCFGATGEAKEGFAEDIARLHTPGEGYVWLHLDRVDRRIVDVLASISVLSAEARETLGGIVDHQFVDHADEIVSGALADHQNEIDGPREDYDFLRFACGPGFIITARRMPICSTQMTRLSLAQGAKVESPAALLEMLIENLCDCTATMLRGIAETLDKIEDNVVIEGRGRDQRGALGKARRKAVRLARQISGLQSTMERLEEATEASRNQAFADLAISLGQRAKSLARDVANLQDRARMLQDEINAILTLETNDRIYTLTVITGLLLPATLVTGFFGMNTKQLIFSESDNGTMYATVLCIAASLCALLIMKFMGLASPNGSKSTPGDGARHKSDR